MASTQDFRPQDLVAAIDSSGHNYRLLGTDQKRPPALEPRCLASIIKIPADLVQSLRRRRLMLHNLRVVVRQEERPIIEELLGLLAAGDHSLAQLRKIMNIPNGALQMEQGSIE